MPGLSLGQTLKDFRKLLARDLATTGVIRSSPHTLQLSSTMYCIIWETSLLGFISSIFFYSCVCVHVHLKIIHSSSFSCSEFKDEESHLWVFLVSIQTWWWWCSHQDDIHNCLSTWRWIKFLNIHDKKNAPYLYNTSSVRWLASRKMGNKQTYIVEEQVSLNTSYQWRKYFTISRL